jgi:hypothetical protein
MCVEALNGSQVGMKGILSVIRLMDRLIFVNPDLREGL